MARRLRFKKGQIEKAIRESKGMLVMAARKLGCDPSTIHNYLNRWPSLRDVARECNEAVNDMTESKLFDAIERGEAWAICFRLKCMAKDRGYVERSEVVQSGKVDHNVNVGIVIAPLRQELLGDARYLDYSGDDPQDVDAGEIRGDGESRALADVAAPAGTEPSANGHYHGNGRH